MKHITTSLPPCVWHAYKDSVLCVPEDTEASIELGSTMVLSCKMVLLPLSLSRSRVNSQRQQLLAPLLPPSLSLTVSSGAAALARASGSGAAATGTGGPSAAAQIKV